MTNVSGLSDLHAAQARKIVLSYVRKFMDNPSDVHYTQSFGGRTGRWSGIEFGHSLAKLTPYYGDCSSTATFILWRALTDVHKGARDIVNGAAWRAGYTGTIASHGRRVVRDTNIRVGDLILYGPAPTYGHVAVAIGGGRCFSHGSESGPYILDLDYRGDRGPTRRFI